MILEKIKVAKDFAENAGKRHIESLDNDGKINKDEERFIKIFNELMDSIDRFVQRNKSKFASDSYKVGDVLVVDWDGNSNVQVTEVNGDKVTINRYDGTTGDLLLGDEDELTLSSNDLDTIKVKKLFSASDASIDVEIDDEDEVVVERYYESDVESQDDMPEVSEVEPTELDEELEFNIEDEEDIPEEELLFPEVEDELIDSDEKDRDNLGFTTDEKEVENKVIDESIDISEVDSDEIIRRSTEILEFASGLDLDDDTSFDELKKEFDLNDEEIEAIVSKLSGDGSRFNELFCDTKKTFATYNPEYADSLYKWMKSTSAFKELMKIADEKSLRLVKKVDDYGEGFRLVVDFGKIEDINTLTNLTKKFEKDFGLHFLGTNIDQDDKTFTYLFDDFKS